MGFVVPKMSDSPKLTFFFLLFEKYVSWRDKPLYDENSEGFVREF